MALDVESSIREVLQREVAGNRVEQWLIASAILVTTFLVLGIGKRLVASHFERVAARTDAHLDDLLVDLVRRTRRFFLFAAALYLASQFIRLPAQTNAQGAADQASSYQTWLKNGVLIATWIQVALWGRGLVLFGIRRAVRGKSADDPARTMGVSVLGFVGQLVVWTLALLMCLETTGVQINSLIASLGVGGIAVALAAQSILGDLFASIAILLDKPFVVGDGIQVGDFSGSVEHIGVKTTRLRSVNGEQIVVGNAALMSSWIRNYKRIKERRIVTPFGVEYGLHADVLASIPRILRAIVEATPGARFERAHFKSFGDSALVFELVYFAETGEYAAMMDIQQQVNLAIYARFEREQIPFAYPTQTLRIAPDAGARRPQSQP